MLTARALGQGDLNSFIWPLTLSTAAGLSTSVGGALAVIRKPSHTTLAGLLGMAIGVMACVSVVELIMRNAMEHDPFLVLASAIAGGAVYWLVEPFFPRVEEEELITKKASGLNLGALPQATTAQPMAPPPPAPEPDADVEGRSTVAVRKKARKVVPANGAPGFQRLSDRDMEPSTKPLLARISTGALRPEELSTSSGPRAAALQQHSSSTTYGHNLEPSSQRPSGDGSRGNGHHQQPAGVNGYGSGTAPMGAGSTAASQQVQPLQGNGTSWDITVDAGGLGSTQHVGNGSNSEPHLAWLDMGAHQHSSNPHTANLMRLGLLMMLTLTLHNIPEGCAVAFSAYTNFGPVMALAIALHNIPEGVVIAAPIYAATGSRWKAVALATLSGLSEPLGAVLALLVLHPFITEERLHYLLAFVGGLMLAVCVIELWPEARACRNDRALAIGAIAGSAIMGWTLAVEG